MKLKPLLAAALLAFAASQSFAQTKPEARTQVPGDTPLIIDGKIVVDATDFNAGILRVPEERRIEVRTSHERIATVVDNIFLTRSMAQRARADGLDKDPVVQRRMQQAAEQVLAELYRNKITREVNAINLDVRARELYRADPSKWVVEEQVHIQHILVNLVGRTRDQALARAKMITDKVRAEPDNFLTFAQQYSDDPERRGNRGDLGFNSAKSLSEGIRTAVATMKPGQISDPVETEHGWHIVKYIGRMPARQQTFEEVKEHLVSEERQRLFKQRWEQIVMDIRSTPTVTVYAENVEKLVVPLPKDFGKVPAPAPAAANPAADAGAPATAIPAAAPAAAAAK
jgi:peptidyl-prolyl cis-trans isomerase C